MGTDRTEKIGGVTLDYSRYPGEDFYCDGAAEDELLQIVKTVPKERYPEVIREKRSWEVLYHLSDLRENIVKWLPMDKGMKVLEVGSGCGAVTGCLSRKAGSVTCVDLSRKRSLINAWRHRERDNIAIHVGNFQDIEPALDTDYDYVCLIGVFEYGQSYIDTKTPFHDFYKIVKKHVRPGGHVVIAIENKMGLKYWAGCREDHLGTFFSGLEDYPQGGVVRTFTKNGLEKILRECMEEDYRFYYPYPDYKFMTMAYSDRYLPKVGELTNNLRNFDRDRMLLFDEKEVFYMIIREGLFPLYSNSYLVLTGPEVETDYSRFSNDRARHLCIRTDIGHTAEGKRYVRKIADNEAADAHIRQLAEHFRVFGDRFAGSGLEINRLVPGKEPDGRSSVSLEFLEDAVTLEELLDTSLQEDDEAEFRSLFEKYRSLVSWNAEGNLQDYDLIFPNICVQGEKWTAIDYEWVTRERTPDDIVRRALYCYVLENEKRASHPILQKILEEMGMDEEAFARQKEQELAFQEEILREADGGKRTAVTDMRHLIGHIAVPYQQFFAHAERKIVQVFEDMGEGYSQEHSRYLRDAYTADDRICAEIRCAAGTKGIRLDPAEMPCLARLEAVTWRDRKLTPAQLARAVVTNGEVLGDGSGVLTRGTDGMTAVLFDHGDPNINVRLDALEETGAEGNGEGILTIEMQILWLSPEMLKDLKARMTRRKRFWFQK